MPDIIILHPKFKDTALQYHGLAIEIKAPEHTRIIKKGKKAGQFTKSIGKLSEEQKETLKMLNAAGYRAVCCFGSEDAIKEIDEYFGVTSFGCWKRSAMSVDEFKSYLLENGSKKGHF